MKQVGNTEEVSKTVKITSESDIVVVRKQVRIAATDMGFGVTDVTRIVTSASELARNILRFAGQGRVEISTVNSSSATGLNLSFIDRGPGIADLNLAMQEGYTTGGGLGLGLPGSKRLMDEIEIETEPGKGTTIVITKWLK